MDEELKPCPCCGGRAERQSRAPGGTGSSGMEPYIQRVGCPSCGLWLSWEHPKDEWGKQAEHDKALCAKQTAAWNRRAPQQGEPGA